MDIDMSEFIYEKIEWKKKQLFIKFKLKKVIKKKIDQLILLISLECNLKNKIYKIKSYLWKDLYKNIVSLFLLLNKDNFEYI